MDMDRPYAAVPSPTTRPVATLPDRPPRRDDVLVFYSDDIAMPPLPFPSTIKDMKALQHNA
jgi:hypothetical protein